MAKNLVFSVSRKGVDAVECKAEMPIGKIEDLLAFKGGEVSVQTPKGAVEVDLPSGLDMLLDQLVVKLQHGVRDFVFPVEDGVKTTKGKKSRFE